MRLFLILLAGIGFSAAGHVSAQQPVTPVAGAQSDITVTATRGRKSNWRVAETDHVIVYGDGGKTDVARTAQNLEKLHFLLAVLLNKINQDDDKAKLKVYLIDDGAEFDAMELANVRVQEGPFADVFPPSYYYDPREDGAVLASSRYDQTIHLTKGVTLSSLQSYSFDQRTGVSESVLFGDANIGNLPSANAITIAVGADARLYNAYAKHFLLTYFPNAYPRWYLDGFGVLFSTVTIPEKGVIEYGRSPSGFGDTIDRYSNLDLRHILDDTYLKVPESRSGWSPAAAWLLVHYLTFAPQRRGQLAAYLAALKQGKSHAEAATVFGDPGKLSRDLTAYRTTKIPYEQMHYPVAMVSTPIIHDLSVGQAAFIKGRLELGSRLFLPPRPSPETDAKRAKVMQARYDHALQNRTKWLANLRADAARYRGDTDAQVLLAEAECRTGNDANCVAAADFALRIAPMQPAALAWKGLAMAHLAAASAIDARVEAIDRARALIVRANRADNEAPQPLLAYYRSYADLGIAAPDSAIDGLIKVTQIVPAAPTPRALLGHEYVERGMAAEAHAMLDPLAAGPFDPPEKSSAEADLRSLSRVSK